MNQVHVLQACRRALAGSVAAAGMVGVLSAPAYAADAPAAVKPVPVVKSKEIKVTTGSRPAAPGGEAGVSKLARAYFPHSTLTAPELPAGTVELSACGGEGKIVGVPAGISPATVNVPAAADSFAHGR